MLTVSEIFQTMALYHHITQHILHVFYTYRYIIQHDICGCHGNLTWKSDSNIIYVNVNAGLNNCLSLNERRVQRVEKVKDVRHMKTVNPHPETHPWPALHTMLLREYTLNATHTQSLPLSLWYVFTLLHVNNALLIPTETRKSSAHCVSLIHWSDTKCAI